MRSAIAGILFAFIAIASASAQDRSNSPFVDHFRTIDDQRWRLSDGWSSGDWFSTEWRASQVNAGHLGARLTLAANTRGDAQKPYVSGELRNLGWFRYGYFASRFRAPRGGGLVAAFFTFADPISADGQNEIDMELTGNAMRQIELTYHVNGHHHRDIVQLGFDASSGFHSYAFEWRPDSIKWYIDNRLVHTSRADVEGLNRPQQIFASLWNSQRMPRWLGRIDPAAAPWTMTVSCIGYAAEYRGRPVC
jgi:endo-1,3-1,4-beta-glycanase ExoK